MKKMTQVKRMAKSGKQSKSGFFSVAIGAVLIACAPSVHADGAFSAKQLLVDGLPSDRVTGPSSDRSTDRALAHPSAVRRPGESYLSAFLESKQARSDEDLKSGSDEFTSPWGSQKSIDQLSPNGVPEIASLEVLQKMFERVRDARDWEWSGRSGFGRRIPWLYVYDGCYVRAELVAEKFHAWGLPEPKQVMAFGNLVGQSQYGTASWWFHVAPVYKTAGKIYVLDASLDAAHPLPLEAWILKMVPTRTDAQISICNAYVVDPEQNCNANGPVWNSSYRDGQTDYYLGEEWNLLREKLGRDPTDLLGTAPPWSGNR